MKLHIALAVSLSLLMCGCQDKPATSADDTATAETAVAANASPAVTKGGSAKGLVKADRETLDSCDSTKVTVSWDISSLTPAINDVEIYANGALFAAGGSVGSQLTDQWVSPGTKFVMKAKPSGEELDTLTIGGPVCAK